MLRRQEHRAAGFRLVYLLVNVLNGEAEPLYVDRLLALVLGPLAEEVRVQYFVEAALL